MAIISRVSQRALWLRRNSSMPVSAGPGAEVPGKLRKHNGVRQSFWRRSTHQPPRSCNDLCFSQATIYYYDIKHLLCAAVKRQRSRSTWQRYRDDLELRRSEHNLPIARGHWRTCHHTMVLARLPWHLSSWTSRDWHRADTAKPQRSLTYLTYNGHNCLISKRIFKKKMH